MPSLLDHTDTVWVDELWEGLCESCAPPKHATVPPCFTHPVNVPPELLDLKPIGLAIRYDTVGCMGASCGGGFGYSLRVDVRDSVLQQRRSNSPLLDDASRIHEMLQGTCHDTGRHMWLMCMEAVRHVVADDPDNFVCAFSCPSPKDGLSTISVPSPCEDSSKDVRFVLAIFRDVVVLMQVHVYTSRTFHVDFSNGYFDVAVDARNVCRQQILEASRTLQEFTDDFACIFQGDENFEDAFQHASEEELSHSDTRENTSCSLYGTWRLMHEQKMARNYQEAFKLRWTRFASTWHPGNGHLVAFAMSQHPRLGAGSSAAWLGSDHVLDIVRAYWEAEVVVGTRELFDFLRVWEERQDAWDEILDENSRMLGSEKK